MTETAEKTKAGTTGCRTWSDDFSKAPTGWRYYFLVRPKGIHPDLDIPYMPTIVQRFEGRFYSVDDELEPIYFGQDEPDDSPSKRKLEWRRLPYDWVLTSDWLTTFDDPKGVTGNDRYYASELLADLTNPDLPRHEIAARWFRRARAENELSRDLSGTMDREEMILALQRFADIADEADQMESVANSGGSVPFTGALATLVELCRSTRSLIAKVSK